MRKTESKRLGCLLLSFLMAFGPASTAVSADEPAETTSGTQSVLQSIGDSLTAITYVEYNEEYKDVGRGTETTTVDVLDFVAEGTNDKTCIVYADASGKVIGDGESREGAEQVLQIGDVGKVTWEVNIPKTGRYAIKVTYAAASDKINSIERTFMINGKVPFSEARYLLLKKNWVNEYQTVPEGAEAERNYTGTERYAFETDHGGNDLRPSCSIDYQWTEYSLTDANGYYADPFEFYFEEGVNTISFGSVREEVLIKEIVLYPYEDLPSYAEYIAGKTEISDGEVVHINAEMPSATSDYTIYPIYDRKSPITEPQHSSKIKLNTIGSEKWQTAGQWIEYTFEVEKAGLYSLAFRYRQNELSGMYVSRKLYVNGEVPFKEANNLKFNYGTNWQVTNASDGATENLKVYLKAGTNTIRLEVTLGEMGGIIRDVTSIMSSINNDYLEILKLTGASPDAYRSYGFGRVMPDVVTDLVIQARNLREVISIIEGMGDIKTESTATLEEIARTLHKMGTNEDEIAKNLSALKGYVGTLGTWINDVKKQPLELDFIEVLPVNAEMPKADANFLEALWYEICTFFASFFTDYNSLGSGGSSEKAQEVEIWVVTGRDEAQIIRTLMDNNFHPEGDYSATLKLVAGGTLLPSVLAGVGPDVALPGTGQDPIQYAIRSAVLALNPEAYEDEPDASEAEKKYNAEMREVFADFNEHAETNFTEASLIPVSLYGKVYGLPATQTWKMMFYRTDILASLGLEIPETWDDLLAMIPVLQFNNMEIGLTNDYQTFLYQMGEDLWADDGMRINLDTNLALDSFETMCDMFTQYSLPYSYDFANRFRTGEMPIAIRDYTDYNNVVIFATEIAGLWEMAPIPGIRQEDGTIKNVTTAATEALVMMSGTDVPEGAWEYMKWYTSREFQVDYSNERVAILGEAAKTPTANKIALEELPWTSTEFAALKEQMDNLEAIYNYPGSYILKRYTDFAFLDAYNNGGDPVDALLGYINAINKEINRKREEFDLETLEIGQKLYEKRIEQIQTIIAELDESVKSANKTALDAVSAAINQQTLISTDLRAAAEGLNTKVEELKLIAEYLVDAANSLDNKFE